VNDRIGVCDYKHSPALYELCDGDRIQLSKCRRANDELFNLCNPENIHKVKKTQFNKSHGGFYYTNICYTNRKRIEINEIMMKKFIEKENKILKDQKKKQLVPLIIKKKEKDEYGQDLMLVHNMPIIAKCGNDKFDIMNNKTFKIIKIDSNDIHIIDDAKVRDSPIAIPISKFNDLFNIAFCVTTHKSQGMSISSDYCIHEWELFDNRLKYVALSRSTEKKYIYIY
jgi:hypothetical protein